MITDGNEVCTLHLTGYGMSANPMQLIVYAQNSFLKDSILLSVTKPILIPSQAFTSLHGCAACAAE